MALTSDGVPAGSPVDFLTGYLRFALGFVGLDDVTFINADAKLKDPEALNRALSEAEALALPQAA